MSLATAALYARVSTRQQEQEATIESQLAQVLQFAQQRDLQIEPSHRYVDQAVSGAQLNRPALDSLRDAAAAGEVTLLLCLSPDRLARSLGLQLLLVNEFRHAGVEVLFLTQPQGGSDPQSELLLQIQGAFAEYERAQIQDRLRRGKLYRLRQGQPPPRAPYGYTYQPRNSHTPPSWLVESAAAAVVRQIFEWYAEGDWTLRQITRELSAQGIPSPMGQLWASATLHRILSQSAYQGIAYVNRQRHPQETIGLPRQRGRGRRQTPVRLPRPPEEWITIPVPALVEPALWQAAQERLKMNARFAPRNSRRLYLLRGLLVCGVCGHILQARTDKKGMITYACRHGAKYRAADIPPHICSIRAAVVEPLVWNALAELLRDPQRLREAWEALQSANSPEHAEVRRWQERRAALQRQDQRLLDAYQVDVMTLSELTQRRQGLQQKIKALDHRLTQIEDAAQRTLALETFRERVERALDAPDPQTQQEVIRLLIERILVTTDSITVEHIIPTKVCRLCYADSRSQIADRRTHRAPILR